MEVLFPVKFDTFSTDNDLMEINTSDPFAFTTCFSDKVAMLMQLAILTVKIVSSNHVCKTVINAKSVTGTCIKGIDELPQWLVAAASRCENPVEATDHAMTRDWKTA